MINTIPSNSEQYNPCDFIYNEQFYLETEYSTMCLNINEIKSIKLINRRDLRINFSVFLIFLIAVYFIILSFDFKVMEKVLLLFNLQPIIIFAIFFRKREYKLILITKNYHLIIKKVNSNYLNEMKDIVFKINERLLNNYAVQKKA